jgi:hypothetical protein
MQVKNRQPIRKKSEKNDNSIARSSSTRPSARVLVPAKYECEIHAVIRTSAPHTQVLASFDNWTQQFADQ